MIADITQMSPGISLGWALMSLAVGVMIVAVVVWRLWRDHQKKKTMQPRSPGSKTTPLASGQDAGGGPDGASKQRAGGDDKRGQSGGENDNGRDDATAT